MTLRKKHWYFFRLYSLHRIYELHTSGTYDCHEKFSYFWELGVIPYLIRTFFGYDHFWVKSIWFYNPGMRNSQSVLPCSVFICEGVTSLFLFLFNLLLNIETAPPRIKKYESVFFGNCALPFTMMAYRDGFSGRGGGGYAPQILADQKTVPKHCITTRHPIFSDLPPSLAKWVKVSKSPKKIMSLILPKKRTKLTILSTDGAQDSEFRSFFGRI